MNDGEREKKNNAREENVTRTIKLMHIHDYTSTDTHTHNRTRMHYKIDRKQWETYKCARVKRDEHK